MIFSNNYRERDNFNYKFLQKTEYDNYYYSKKENGPYCANALYVIFKIRTITNIEKKIAN